MNTPSISQPPRRRHPGMFLCLIAVLAFVSAASAQPTFKLKRTKSVTQNVTVSILGGYNGMTDPSNALQDLFENTQATSWGGVMIGLQAIVAIDTVGVPIGAGAEVYFHRMAKRYLGPFCTTCNHPPGTPSIGYTSDSSLVSADETLDGWGGNLLVAFDLPLRLHLQLGAGVQYLDSRTDVASEVFGLFEPRFLFTALGAVRSEIFTYEHGSVDLNLRLVRGFGRFGSLQFQSLLGFTFKF